MKLNKRLLYHYRVWLNDLRKRRRLLFPSPAEVEFVRIFGGRYVTFARIKDRQTGFPLTVITSMGTVLERELIKREVRVGKYFIDFAAITPYYKKGIEIDGRQWHRDIVKEQNRDDYITGFGWHLFHINAADVYRQPNLVQRRVLEWLSK